MIPWTKSVAQPLQQPFHVPHAFPEFADMGIDPSQVAAHVPDIMPRLPPQALDLVPPSPVAGLGSRPASPVAGLGSRPPRLLPQAPHFATQPSHAGQRQSAKTDAHCRHCYQYPDQIDIHGRGLHLMARDGIRLHLAIKGFRAIGSILPVAPHRLSTLVTYNDDRGKSAIGHRKSSQEGA